jgi:hypothetical protein
MLLLLARTAAPPTDRDVVRHRDDTGDQQPPQGPGWQEDLSTMSGLSTAPTTPPSASFQTGPHGDLLDLDDQVG